ncbi:LytR C-terminal domain-containing protein [Streptomyces sp. CNQ085]|uniref:LytR C-terminal domain-containing protein n=1 Tax=Streptomyces sp. CNQ085 TaxID=2886944 RepID=UPI001F50EAA1|nr:LytR C-terminal domain-containing protein [Streptomyces sp. CNQ085]MCI0387079.1 LytR C-terminal domain-containing protein [Streptomyces sp. CNQ085]
MSMLTPPGMGGKYRITGNSYPRMRRPRRRRRIVAASVAATAAVGVLSWGTVQLLDVFTGGGTTVRAAGDAPGCERSGGGPSKNGGTGVAARSAGGESPGASPDALPKPSAITVNVYNATTRGGLARKTADTLEKRGFTIGEVANAPASLDKKVEKTGLLMGPPAAYGNGAFDVLLAQLPGAEVRAVERRMSGESGESGDGKSEIDLVIGKGFKALAGEKDVREAMAALASPSPSPSASGCR